MRHGGDLISTDIATRSLTAPRAEFSSAPGRRIGRRRQENWIGSIALGKIANFTALEDDPYAVEPIKLKDIAVWGAVFEGAVCPVERG
jgi:hypothetical protein